jgi:hypothetical protein
MAKAKKDETINLDAYTKNGPPRPKYIGSESPFSMAFINKTDILC